MEQGIEGNFASSQVSEGSSTPEPRSPEASPGARPLDLTPANAEQKFRKSDPRKVRRTDSGKLHSVKHGILSREILDALVQLGGDPRTFRQLEKLYRTALQPSGPIGNLIFDRFWSSYLRLVLSGQLETQQFGGKSGGEKKPAPLVLVPGHQPTLVHQDPNGQPSAATQLDQELPPDLFRRLVLVQRYDRHFSREMFRSLALLLLMRRSGEAGLESWAIEMLGTERSGGKE